MSRFQRIVAAGAVLIGAGVLTVLRQVMTASPDPQLSGLGQWIVGAQFPGTILMIMGMFLWLLAVLMES